MYKSIVNLIYYALLLSYLISIHSLCKDLYLIYSLIKPQNYEFPAVFWTVYSWIKLRNGWRNSQFFLNFRHMEQSKIYCIDIFILNSILSFRRRLLLCTASVQSLSTRNLTLLKSYKQKPNINGVELLHWHFLLYQPILKNARVIVTFDTEPRKK